MVLGCEPASKMQPHYAEVDASASQGGRCVMAVWGGRTMCTRGNCGSHTLYELCDSCRDSV